jgi:hypothetical protein
MTTSVATADLAYRQDTSSYATWRLCLWAGPVFLVGFIIFWAILGYNVPPISPAMSQADLAAHYTEHSVRIRIAMAGTVFFGPLYFVFSAAISHILKRIEGREGPLSTVEQMGGVVTTVVILIGGICWMTAAHRIEERTPEMIRQLHDYGWLFFDTTYMATTMQTFATAIVILRDRRSQPIFPTWLAWFSIFTGAIFFFDSLLPFFFTGPLAWNGLINYWVGFSAYFLWIVFFSWYGFKAVQRLEADDARSA